MKNKFSIVFKLLILHYLSVLGHSQDFDFFYFVQQWPGSYCDTRHSCCYPKTGKPTADFGIHGLWPNYNDGSYPSSCNPDSIYDKSQLSDLTSSLQKNWPTLACPTGDGHKFWSHEWIKHGTCSESELDQHDYFQSALNLKAKLNLLQILNNAGIKANDGFYELSSIEEAIKEATGYTPGIECNVDGSKNSQLFQIYMCVNTSGSDLIQCPILPRGRCADQVQFPRF
ncbi:ribonuclease 3-like [Mercurialis annua]|uniref:ribonuclease 3-like n=1 Tax=Mercurialis annua TaxID=3986 RepID=UPI00215F5A8D|nr:ribonuclease 3-like [Mercurialis annua]